MRLKVSAITKISWRRILESTLEYLETNLSALVQISSAISMDMPHVMHPKEVNKGPSRHHNKIDNSRYSIEKSTNDRIDAKHGGRLSGDLAEVLGTEKVGIVDLSERRRKDRIEHFPKSNKSVS